MASPAVFRPSGAGVEEVARIRAFVRTEVERLGLFGLRDDAALVATELATNAILHGGGVVRVVVRPNSHGVRIEVHDAVRAGPVLAAPRTDAMTGRGVGLIAALAAGWGAEATDDGKVVWADVSTETGAADGAAAPYPTARGVEMAAPTAGVRHRVTLGSVPTELLLAAKAHVDNLVREFTLVTTGAGSGRTGAVPPHLAAIVETVVNRFSEARLEIKRQALTAARSGKRHTHLELRLPADAADAAVEYLEALDEADSYCRAARLLTLESPPQHRLFRQWYVGEIVRQLRAVAEGRRVPPPETFEQRLLREVDAIARAQRASERAARLFRVSSALGRAWTPEAVASAVLEEGAPVLGASGGGLLLAASGDRLMVPGTVGYDEEIVRKLRAETADAELPAAIALRTGEPVWLESSADRDRRFPGLVSFERGTVSMCAVPLVSGDRRLGALRFSFHEPKLFDEDERAFVLALAAQAAQALDRAQLYAQRMDTSRRLQRSLLPGRLPDPPELAIAAVYHPLGDGIELGGDFYDVWPLGPGQWALAIGDAAGTGPEAAAITAMARFSLRALTVADHDAGSVVANLNRSLVDAEASGAEGERFCTAILGVLRMGDGDGADALLELAGGGHPAPVVRRADGSVEEVHVGGELLGAFEDAHIEAHSVALRRGDIVVLFTDGLIEGRRDGEMFGVERVQAALASAPSGAAAVAGAIETAVLDFIGTSIGDDLALLVIELR